MGYQVTFTPTEEKMEEYKKKPTFGSYYKSIDGYKKEIFSYCMKPTEDAPAVIQSKLNALLTYLNQLIKEDERQNAYDRWESDENHELWYCGWQFAKDSSITEEELINNTIDNLFLFVDIVKTPDYFDEHEKFYDKLNDVNNEIDGFIECAQEIIIHEIIDDLEPFKVKDDDDNEEAN